jgi:hypothetical protein
LGKKYIKRYKSLSYIIYISCLFTNALYAILGVDMQEEDGESIGTQIVLILSQIIQALVEFYMIYLFCSGVVFFISKMYEMLER